MIIATRQTVIVKPGGVIDIRDPQLPAGAVAEVIVLLTDTSGEAPPLASLIGAARGSFATPEDADAFLDGERDSWVL